MGPVRLLIAERVAIAKSGGRSYNEDDFAPIAAANVRSRPFCFPGGLAVLELLRALREAGYGAVPAYDVLPGRRRMWPYAVLPRWGVAVTVGRRTDRDRMRDRALQLSGWIVVRAPSVAEAVAMARDEVDALRMRAPAG